MEFALAKFFPVKIVRYTVCKNIFKIDTGYKQKTSEVYMFLM